MEIWHHYGFRNAEDERIRIYLIENNIRFLFTPGLQNQSHLITFDINENDPHYPDLNHVLIQIHALDIPYTIDSDEELRVAQWVRMMVLYKRGYPQPKNTWLDDPPNFAEWCPWCGTYKQTGCYRMSGEANLEKRDFFSLHWISEPLCTQKVVQEIAQHSFTGYEFWDVIVHKTGQASELVKQLYIPYVCQPGFVDQGDLPFKTCDRCGIKKYLPHVRGRMLYQRDSIPEGLDFFLTHEWFGDGRMAFHEMIISNRVAQLILDKKWQGLHLKVLDLV